MEERLKIVEYEKYCGRCVHSDRDPWDDPCDECLGVPAREYSHRPVNFKESPSKRKDCDCEECTE